MKFIKFTIILTALTFLAYIVVFSNINDKNIGKEGVKEIEDLQINNEALSVSEAVIYKSAEEKREALSLATVAGDYNIENCINIKHTDNIPLKVCISQIEGIANGFYDYNKNLIVVETLDIATIVHELVHASTVHNSIQIEDDIKRVTEPKFQERIAYDVEYMLTQILDSQR